MPCYLITHQPIGEFSQETLLDCEQRLMALLPKGTKWELGWYIPAENTLVCHWDAPSSDVVLSALEQAGIGQIMTLVKIQEAVEVHPEWYSRRRRGRPRGSGKAHAPVAI